MKFITPAEFEKRELKNGEEYILVFDVGHPLTTADRNRIIYQLSDSQNRFAVVDEWDDPSFRYYVKIRITNNLVVGLAVILVLSTVFVFVAGLYLSDMFTSVGIAAEKTLPLAVIGLVVVGVYAGLKWMKKGRRSR